jgi:hypothetical protein
VCLYAIVCVRLRVSVDNATCLRGKRRECVSVRDCCRAPVRACVRGVRLVCTQTVDGACRGQIVHLIGDYIGAEFSLSSTPVRRREVGGDGGGGGGGGAAPVSPSAPVFLAPGSSYGRPMPAAAPATAGVPESPKSGSLIRSFEGPTD